MRDRTMLRFRRRTIWFHWVHTIAFVVLLLTGGFSLVSGSGAFVGSKALAHLHLGAGALYVGSALGYLATDHRSALRSLKGAFIPARDDLRWLKAAPGFYFGGSGGDMPPQGFWNPGQRMWQGVAVTTGIVFVVSGAIMRFLGDSFAPSEYQWILNVHALASVPAGALFLLHVYLSVAHPRTRQALRSMWDGSMSPEYARRHHEKWCRDLDPGQGD